MHSPILNEFIQNHPVDVVRIVEKLDQEEISYFFDHLSTDSLCLLFAYLHLDIAADVIQSVKPDKALALVENLSSDQIIPVLRKIPPPFRKLLFGKMSEEKAEHFERIISFRDTSVGAIIESAAISLPEDITVKEALGRIKKQIQKSSHYVYIVSRTHLLVGFLTLDQLIKAPADTLLHAIMNTQMITLAADVSYLSLADHPGWQDNTELPVIDRSNRFLGVLKYQTLRSLESMNEKSPIPKNIYATSNALGELYRIGLTSLIKGSVEFYNKKKKKSKR